MSDQPFGDIPLSDLLRQAALALTAGNDGRAAYMPRELASELRVRAILLQHAAKDTGGHESSRRTLLVALGEVRP